MMQKLKTFTLIELIVAMLISSLVITISYYSYSIISRQFIYFRNINEYTIEITRLNTVLKTDFAESKYCSQQANGLSFVFEDNRKVSYEFYPEHIIRYMPGLTDTFHIQPANLNKLFFNEPSNNPKGLIDELSFESQQDKEIKYFHYRKDYGADVLIMLEKTM